MGKKVREYKSGDFIFAKVKGYPAWPARVQKSNGKKYFVYFYGTGETANLSPTMIFDYAENKDKFLTKTVKRRDFNDGVKQIEHDFANKVPLEQVIGVSVEVPPAESSTNDSANDSGANDTMDDSAIDTTAADETMADDTTLNATQNDTAVEDSDDTGNLQKQSKKGKTDVKAKDTPVKPVKELKTPRGKGKKDDAPKEDDEEKKEEEIVSRSGRKIRPKRYIDEQTEDNATLPSPAQKKRRGGSPTPDKEKEKTDTKEKVPDKNIKHFNAVPQSELEDLKEPFKPDSNSNQEVEPSVTQTKIIPTFGKKKNLKKDSKQVAKTKKFVPPIKNTLNNQPSKDYTDPILKCLDQHLQPTSYPSQDSSNMNLHSLATQNMEDISYMSQINQYFTNINTFSNMLSPLDSSINIDNIDYVHNTCQSIGKADNALQGIDNLNTGGIPQPKKILHENKSIDIQEKRNITNQKVSLPKRKKSNILGNIISSSLNMLDNEDIIPAENLSQESISDHSSIKVLSQSRDQSFCSVASLNKTYKNLDCNSFKNDLHKVPEGNEFLDLFKNNISERVDKPVAMSTEFGDIGFNTKYSDFIRDVPQTVDQTDEEKETCLKIINIYPKENSILKKKLCK